MDPSNVLRKTYVYKANCEECRKLVKEFLSRAKPSAYSIKVKGEVGKMTVESIVNPEEVAATSGEAIIKDHEERASCEAHTATPPNEEEITTNNNNINNNNNNKQEAVAEGTSTLIFKGFEGGNLQELAKTNKLKRLEITQNLKMTFTEGKNDNDDDEASQNVAEPKKFDHQNHSIGTNASLPQSKANVVTNSFDSASNICGIL